MLNARRVLPESLLVMRCLLYASSVACIVYCLQYLLLALSIACIVCCMRCLLHAFRFEKRIFIPLPEKNARTDIFKIHIGNTPNSLVEEDFRRLGDTSEG